MRNFSGHAVEPHSNSCTRRTYFFVPKKKTYRSSLRSSYIDTSLIRERSRAQQLLAVSRERMRVAVPSVTNGCEGEHKLPSEELAHLYSLSRLAMRLKND